MRPSASASRPNSSAESGAGAAFAAAAVLALTACSDPSSPQPWPLSPVRLSDLSCQPAVSKAGECARDRDCEGGAVCAFSAEAEVADREPLALVCGREVGAGRPRAPCDHGADCASGICSLSGACVQPCAADEDCSLGEACQPVEARIADGLAPVQACARVAALPADVELAVESLGRLRAGQSHQVQLAARGTDALFYLAADCGRTITVERMVERGTTHVWFDLASQLQGNVQPNPVTGAGALVPILVPDNPRLSLAPGYDLNVRLDEDSAVQLITAQRSGRGRVLDINIYYVGGGSNFREGGLAPGAREIAAVMRRLEARYAAIGIELGAVREYDVIGALRDELGELPLRSRFDEQGRFLGQEVVGLERLFTLSAGSAQGGVNLFLTRSLGALLGVSGGTPGAVGLMGTSLSGSAVALDRLPIEHADRVLFHEIGHQLGLFHTTESDGSSLEPLSDTPICGPEFDANGDGMVRAEECGDHGADNVMFWQGEGDALSEQQVEILQRSLLLR